MSIRMDKPPTSSSGSSSTADNPEVESDFLRSVHALLRELDGHHPAFQSERGMLRWTLHKKIDRHLSNGVLLAKILVKELERAERCGYRQYIIPLLHTLMYTLMKASGIPDDLYERVYDFCKKLLTLPKPYCSIGLHYAQQLKLERTVPGILYQRLVSAEQSLKNDSFPYKEKVFMFADSDFLSEAVRRAVATEIKAARSSQCTRSSMICVIEHAFQEGLKEHCDFKAMQAVLQVDGGVKVIECLVEYTQDLFTLRPDNKNVINVMEAKPLDEIEHCFQQVVAAMEHAGKDTNAEYNLYVEELEKMYSTLLTTSKKDVEEAAAEGNPGIPLPNPNISFHLWTDEDQLWKELVLFLRPQSHSWEEDSLSQVLDSFEIQMGPDEDTCEKARFSVLSTDSGIERDLPTPEDDVPEMERSRLQRKGGIKKKASMQDCLSLLQTGSNGQAAKPAGKLYRKCGSSFMEPITPMKRLHTARVLVLGDDRVLGRLVQAYYFLRKRESRRTYLTTRLKMQFYYVPVMEEQPSSCSMEEYALPDRTEPCELAAYLGRVDPWYESNVNTLCHMIPRLATMPSSPSKTSVSELFIIDVVAYYVRLGLQPIYFQVYTVKLFFKNEGLEPAEDIFLIELHVTLEELDPSRDNLLMKKKMMVEVPGADVTLVYKKVLLSNREKEETVSLRCTGLVMKAIPANETEDLVCLNVNTAEIVKTANLSGRSYSLVTNRIRTRNIRMQSTEQRPFTVCLDKDSRRVYKNVIGIEVSPCLEPSYSLQKARARQTGLPGDEDVGLAKYLPKSLLLPINTFSGIIQ